MAQRKPNEAGEKAGGNFASSPNRRITVVLTIHFFLALPSQVVLLSFAFPLRLCASAVKI
jgi:hypothetical protein